MKGGGRAHSCFSMTFWSPPPPKNSARPLSWTNFSNYPLSACTQTCVTSCVNKRTQKYAQSFNKPTPESNTPWRGGGVGPSIRCFCATCFVMPSESLFPSFFCEAFLSHGSGGAVQILNHYFFEPVRLAVRWERYKFVGKGSPLLASRLLATHPLASLAAFVLICH